MTHDTAYEEFEREKKEKGTSDGNGEQKILCIADEAINATLGDTCK